MALGIQFFKYYFECHGHILVFSALHWPNDNTIAFVNIGNKKIIHARVGFYWELTW